MRRAWIIFLGVACCSLSRSQEFSPRYFLDSLKTEQQLILENLDRFATPEYYSRVASIRTVQRRGYAEVLAAAERSDGLGALLAYVKLRLQLDYALNHAPIMVPTLMGRLIALPMDWTMPPDPWRRKR